MIRHDQLFLHDPPKSYGDCARTCYACLLEVPPVDVPHFSLLVWNDGMSDEQRQEAERAWLRTRGFDQVTLNMVEVRPEFFKHLPKVLCIAGGASHRHGDGHCVIWQMDENGGTLVHDPHPSRLGLKGAPEQLTFLVPIDPAKLVHP